MALLLLLADAPAGFTAARAAYGAALSTVLADLKAGGRAATLDIAVMVRGLRQQPGGKRPFARLQQLLADIYKLLGSLSVHLSVELDGPRGIDARVFFVDREPQAAYSCGPIIAADTLLASSRRWGTVYLPSGDGADGFARSLCERLSSKCSDTRHLPGPAAEHMQVAGAAPAESISTGQEASMHCSVAVGGTFDHLHAGHKLLLTATVLALDTCRGRSRKRIITIGITGDELLVNKKYAEFLESWDDRWKGVWAFLQSVVTFSAPGLEADIRHEPQEKRVVVLCGPDLEFRFVEIADPFGPTVTDEHITALVVSRETRSGGKAVNDERAKKGWPALDVFEVAVLDASDDASVPDDNFSSKISSTEARRRQMDLAKGSSL